MDLFEHAEAQREAGMLQAVTHAEESYSGWSDRAYDFLKRYAKEHPEFISEDVSDAAIAAGEPQPPTLRAWGQVYRRAVKDDVIIQVGAGRSRRRHASICPRWGSCVYRRSA
jgi:hypothetical protein